MPIKPVAADGPLYPEVLRLWRADSDLLGFMPEGGFLDAMRAGCLLAEVARDGSVQGYVMFRRNSRGAVAIVHLCVAPTSRGTGTARKLFDAVRSSCADAYEINVRCRRDFAAHKMWPRLGFTVAGEAPGKAGMLTIWRYQIAQLPLFALLAGLPSPTSAVRVAIDANVFFDLEEESPGFQESCGLLADWLGEHVELAVTEELFNEIDRREDPDDRRRHRARAARFGKIERNQAEELRALAKVRELLPQAERPSDHSDAKQLAMVVAGGVTFFVTRDEEVLAAADKLEDAFGIEVMRPVEMVLRHDQLRRAEAYRPRRLFLRPQVIDTLPSAEHLEPMVELMHVGQSAPEPRHRTRARIRQWLAHPQRAQATCIERDGELLAAYVVCRDKPDVLNVPYFAVANSTLGRTAARHYAELLLKLAATERRRLVHFDEPGARASEALSDLGFTRSEEGWLKLALPLVLGPDEAACEVDRIGQAHRVAAELTRTVSGALRSLGDGPGVVSRTADLEKSLWPAKLTGSGLPCFLAPIRPEWAKELFDRELAAGTLFGASPSLALSCENVYYRAAVPAILTAPARILWYVSQDRRYPSAMAVRACSQIDEVVVGTAKDLFRRFNHLGVYEWKHVLEVAGGDPAAELMAFRFSGTELFPRPIAWEAMQETLQRCGLRRNQLMSALGLPEACFVDLYSQGTRVDAA